MGRRVVVMVGNDPLYHFCYISAAMLFSYTAALQQENVIFSKSDLEIFDEL